MISNYNDTNVDTTIQFVRQIFQPKRIFLTLNRNNIFFDKVGSTRAVFQFTPSMAKTNEAALLQVRQNWKYFFRTVQKCCFLVVSEHKKWQNFEFNIFTLWHPDRGSKRYLKFSIFYHRFFQFSGVGENVFLPHTVACSTLKVTPDAVFLIQVLFHRHRINA